MATAIPLIDDDMLDHLDAVEVADGIERIANGLHLSGFETSIARDNASVRLEFAAPADPRVAASVVRLHPRPLACTGQGHASHGSWFDFALARDLPLPTRVEDAAAELAASGFVPTFVLASSAETATCACTGLSEDRPTEEPIGLACFVLDEDGDRIASCVFADHATAIAGIAAQMDAEGVPGWVVVGADGVREAFGDVADDLDADDGLLADTPVDEDDADGDFAEIEADAHLRSLRIAA